MFQKFAENLFLRDNLDRPIGSAKAQSGRFAIVRRYLFSAVLFVPLVDLLESNFIKKQFLKI